MIHFRGPFVASGGISMDGERKNMRGTEKYELADSGIYIVLSGYQPLVDYSMQLNQSVIVFAVMVH